jgi:hypothetical protein
MDISVTTMDISQIMEEAMQVTVNNCYIEGMKEYYAGTDINDNPYDKNQPEEHEKYLQWDAGWQDAWDINNFINI